MSGWPKRVIGDLISDGSILVHKDGNHGANYPRSDEFGDQGLPFLTAKSLSDWRIDIENAPKLSVEKAASFKFGFVKENDVLLSHNATVGRVAVMPKFDAEVVIGTSLTQYRVNEDKISPAFLAFYFSSSEFQENLEFVMSQTTRNQVPITQQRRLWVRLPTIEVQKEIVDTVSPLQDKIEVNRKASATLEAMARALYRSWFVDFDPVWAKLEGRPPAHMDPTTAALFPDSFDDDGLPLGWEMQPIIEQANWVNGAAFKNMHFSVDPDALPVIKIAELKAGITASTKFTATDLGEKFKIENCELLFSWSGNPDTSIDAFVWPLGSAWLNQHIFAVRENGKLSKAMLFTMLRFFKPAMAEIARDKQTTGLGHITRKDLERFPVAIAPAEVMLAFTGVVTPLFENYSRLLCENQTLAALRDSLLPKLMSGEIRVGDVRAQIEDVA